MSSCCIHMQPLLKSDDFCSVAMLKFFDCLGLLSFCFMGFFLFYLHISFNILNYQVYAGLQWVVTMPVGRNHGLAG